VKKQNNFEFLLFSTKTMENRSFADFLFAEKRKQKRNGIGVKKVLKTYESWKRKGYKKETKNKQNKNKTEAEYKNKWATHKNNQASIDTEE